MTWCYTLNSCLCLTNAWLLLGPVVSDLTLYNNLLHKEYQNHSLWSICSVKANTFMMVFLTGIHWYSRLRAMFTNQTVFMLVWKLQNCLQQFSLFSWWAEQVFDVIYMASLSMDFSSFTQWSFLPSVMNWTRFFVLADSICARWTTIDNDFKSCFYLYYTGLIHNCEFLLLQFILTPLLELHVARIFSALHFRTCTFLPWHQSFPRT